MNATIIFGTKRLGKVSSNNISTEKYPNIPVITVEGLKGAKKSRRILMNSKAADLLNCTVGDIQHIVFASVEMDDNSPKQVLITNDATLPEKADVSYKTSKNRVSFGEDTSEKGKAITSSYMCREIFSFLDMDDSANIEFQLNEFDNPEIEAFSLDAVGTVVESISGAVNNSIADIPVIESNNGELTSEQLHESIQDIIAKAEEASPVLESDFEESVENKDFTEEVNEVEAEDVVSEWN